jgi:MoxR-like ATPase
MVTADREITEKTEMVQGIQKEISSVREQIQGIVAGHGEVINNLIISLLAGGHVLLEGVPGIGKTLLARTVSECIGCTYARVQFTPDLLPSDIIGTRIYNQRDATFSVVKGPVFHQFILADEINRAPPKVQSALLEAMQERQVTIYGETFPLEQPFFVLATENPIESEGTYPLPEAQVDRFIMKLIMKYPDREEEEIILERFASDKKINPVQVIDAEKILQMQHIVRSVYADPAVTGYVTSITSATRRPREYGLDLDGVIAWGSSPRGSLGLLLCAKAHAATMGRGYVVPDDVAAVAHEVLRHRILLTFEAEAEGATSDSVINRILHAVKVP